MYINDNTNTNTETNTNTDTNANTNTNTTNITNKQTNILKTPLSNDIQRFSWCCFDFHPPTLISTFRKGGCSGNRV